MRPSSSALEQQCLCFAIQYTRFLTSSVAGLRRPDVVSFSDGNSARSYILSVIWLLVWLISNGTGKHDTLETRVVPSSVEAVQVPEAELQQVVQTG